MNDGTEQMSNVDNSYYKVTILQALKFPDSVEFLCKLH